MPAPDEIPLTNAEHHELRLQLWARAHHEAAHAVVGTLLGGRVAEVAIWSGPPVGGNVRLLGQVEPETAHAMHAHHALVQRIVYLLAGPIAARIASGGAGLIMNEPASMVASVLLAAIRTPAPAHHEANQETDQGIAAEAQETELGTVAGLIRDHFGPEDEAGAAAAIDHLPLHVETLLRDRWSAIETIAISLLRHGRLTEDQFQRLFSDALPAPEMGALLDPSSA